MALLSAVAIASPAVAEDSVVLGHAVSNAFLSHQPCPQPADPNVQSICMDGNFVWILDAVHTVSGPMIRGRIRALSSQHTYASAQFVKSVEIFVLRPIDDPAMRRSARAKYSLVTLSSRDSQGRYCFNLPPAEVGLKLDPAQVKLDAVSRGFCFPARALTLNSH
jgi:hypothetical protein